MSGNLIPPAETSPSSDTTPERSNKFASILWRGYAGVWATFLGGAVGMAGLTSAIHEINEKDTSGGALVLSGALVLGGATVVSRCITVVETAIADAYDTGKQEAADELPGPELPPKTLWLGPPQE